MDSRLNNEKSKVNSSSKFFTTIVSLILCILSVLLIVNSIKSINISYKRSLLLDQAKSEVNDLRLRNLELLQHKEYVSSLAYVENEARNRLNYAKIGETMVVLQKTGPEDATKENEDDDSKSDDAAEESGGWMRWWTVLREGV